MTQIPNFEGYFITDDWRCYSTKKNDYIGSIRNDGHISLTLYNGNEIKPTRLHIIIAEMFVPIPEEYKGIPKENLVVHHKDFDGLNNNPSNLQWMTDEQHRSLHGKVKTFSSDYRKKLSEARKGMHLSDEAKRKLSEANKGRIPWNKGKPRPEGAGKPPRAVEQWSKDGTTLIARYESISEAARQTGVEMRNISACCREKLKSAGGYKWRYAD